MLSYLSRYLLKNVLDCFDCGIHKGVSIDLVEQQDNSVDYNKIGSSLTGVQLVHMLYNIIPRLQKI